MNPKTAIEQLRNAVENEGARPDVHRAVMRETERQWPTLMRAVRAVLDAHPPEPKGANER